MDYWLMNIFYLSFQSSSFIFLGDPFWINIECNQLTHTFYITQLL